MVARRHAIAQAFGKDDQGIYVWFADLDPDNDGWNTSDQGDGKTDAFPMMEHNGKTVIAMVMEIIHYPLPKVMNVPTHTEPVSKIDSDA